MATESEQKYAPPGSAEYRIHLQQQKRKKRKTAPPPEPEPEE